MKIKDCIESISSEEIDLTFQKAFDNRLYSYCFMIQWNKLELKYKLVKALRKINSFNNNVLYKTIKEELKTHLGRIKKTDPILSPLNINVSHIFSSSEGARKIRNQIAHGNIIISIDILNQYKNEIESLTNDLSNNIITEVNRLLQLINNEILSCNNQISNYPITSKAKRLIEQKKKRKRLRSIHKDLISLQLRFTSY